jgi:mannose-6-phosphate isomerase
MTPLAPFPIAPREVPVLWGGEALVRRFGKPGDPNAAIGESWECWDDNRVSAGQFAGETIADLRTNLGPAFLGTLDPARAFPILTKFIDARQSLSVQVHPDDAYAQRVEHQPNGKTECWVVLDSAPGAQIVLGWNRDLTREEYVRRVADGTLGEVLRYVPARPGDVFYLPSGTLHAIGPGIILYETQQTSDLTYRIFDWNRLGADGKPRRLDVDKAADVLDYHASTAGALSHLAYVLDGVPRTALIADPRFVVERVAIGPTPARIDLEGMPLIVTALAQGVDVKGGDDTVTSLHPYETCLVPAAAGTCTLSAADAAATVLAIAPPSGADALAQRLTRAGVPLADIQGFLGQFSHAP